MTAELCVRAFNHLLTAESWAQSRLTPFVGRIIELQAAPWPAVRTVVTATGLLASVEAGTPSGAPAADLVVTIRPSAALAMLRSREALSRRIDLTGDPALAAAVGELVTHLRWDVEEDLSRIVGDVAAQRLGNAARRMRAWQSEGLDRFGRNLSEYATEERRLIISRTQLEQFAREIAELEAATIAMEGRIARLEQSRHSSG